MRALRLIAVGWFVVATSIASSAGAQERNRPVQTDSFGLPIRFVPLALSPGRRYEIRTDYLLTRLPLGPRPDAVLSLLDDVRGPDVRTVQGASACFLAPDRALLGPACFQYAVPATSDGSYVLVLRARRTNTPGQTALWYRDITPGSAIGPWLSITDLVTFGGGVAPMDIPTRDRYVVQTAHRPGRSVTHTIMTSGIAEWQIARIDHINGRIGDTAMLDLLPALPRRGPRALAGPRRHVFGTAFAAQGGPVRLVRNEWFVPGRDRDGDGLDRRLEAALGTCDDPSDVLASGFRCGQVEECRLGLTPDDCLDTMRDSDHDGLRDDLELFGFDHPLLHIARWGAEPAQFDVFVEMDTQDQDDDEDGCQSFDSLIDPPTLGGGDEDFFARATEIYASYPASRNPNGQPGIRLHYDIGVPNPNSRDTRWGDWGGGGSCVPAGCGNNAYDNAPACRFRPEDPFPIHSLRKWVFNFAVDTVSGGGQAHQAVIYSASSLIGHVHELGHLGHLSHGGPEGSAGGGNRHPDTATNRRANYRSRINYAYQNAGSGTLFGDPAAGPRVVDPAIWRTVSFSDGSLPGAVSSRGASELCPFGSAVSLATLNLIRESAAFDGSCWNVDWDLNGSINSGLRPMLRLHENFGVHREVAGMVSQRPVASSGSATIVRQGGENNSAVLLFADVSSADASGQRLIELRGDGSMDCRPHPISAPDSPDFGYPPCFVHGTPVGTGIPARAVAITSAPILVDGSYREGAVMVWLHAELDQVPELRWASFTVSAAATPQEMTVDRLEARGAVYAVVDVPPRTAYSFEPALVRVPGSDGDPMSDELILAWPDEEGRTRFSVLRPDGAMRWSDVRVAMTSEVGGPLDQVVFDSAVSLAARGSEVWMAGAGPGKIAIHRLERGLDDALTWPLDVRFTAASACSNDRPEMVVAPDLGTPAVARRWVLWRGCDSVLWLASEGAAGFSSPRAFRPFESSGDTLTLASPVAVWDDRGALDARNQGLRVYRYPPASRAQCDSPNDCGAGQRCGPGHCECVTDAGCSHIPHTRCADNECVDIDDPTLPMAVVTMSPFGRGPSPTYVVDYDDWVGMRWGYCETRAVTSFNDPDYPPATTDDYIRRSYRERERCGPAPRYPEAGSGGGMAISAPVGPTDRADRPWLYEIPGDFDCP